MRGGHLCITCDVTKIRVTLVKLKPRPMILAGGLTSTSIFWYHLCVCVVGSFALLSVCLDVCDLTKIHILGTAWHMALKFGQGMDMGNLEVDPGNQALHNQCSLHLAYTACTPPVHCRCTAVQAGPWHRQVGSLQRQVAFFFRFPPPLDHNAFKIDH